MIHGRDVVGRAVLIGVSLLPAAVCAQDARALMDALGDPARASRVLRELAATPDVAVGRIVEGYAAARETQAGLVDRRRAVAALEAITARAPVSTARVDALLDELESCEDAARIEALLAALGVLVPTVMDPALETRALSLASNRVVSLWHGERGRWTAGEVSTPLIEGYRAIARMQIPRGTSCDRLADLMFADDPFTRECAALRLAACGRSALPLLVDACRRSHPDRSRGVVIVQLPGTPAVRLAAARSIARLAPERPEAVDGLFWILRYGVGDERLQAVAALGRAAPERRPAVVHKLILLARGSEARLAVEAIAALGALGSDAHAAVPALSRLAADDESSLAAPAAAALRQIRAR